MTKGKSGKSPSPLPSGVPGASYDDAKGNKSPAAREEDTPVPAARRAPDAVSPIMKGAMKSRDTRMVVNALLGEPEAAAAVLAWDEDKLNLLGDTLQDAIYLRHLGLNPFLGAKVILQEHLADLVRRLDEFDGQLKQLNGLAVTQPNMRLQLLGVTRGMEDTAKEIRREQEGVKQRIANIESRLPAMDAQHVAAVADFRSRQDAMKGELDRSSAMLANQERYMQLKEEMVQVLHKMQELETALAEAQQQKQKKKKRVRSPSPEVVISDPPESSEELVEEQPAKEEDRRRAHRAAEAAARGRQG